MIYTFFFCYIINNRLFSKIHLVLCIHSCNCTLIKVFHDLLYISPYFSCRKILTSTSIPAPRSGRVRFTSDEPKNGELGDSEDYIHRLENLQTRLGTLQNGRLMFEPLTYWNLNYRACATGTDPGQSARRYSLTRLYPGGSYIFGILILKSLKPQMDCFSKKN
jgi:hypothetical protein